MLVTVVTCSHAGRKCPSSGVLSGFLGWKQDFFWKMIDELVLHHLQNDVQLMVGQKLNNTHGIVRMLWLLELT